MHATRIKLSLIIAGLALLIVVVAYIYSLWSIDRQKQAELPVEAVGMMMRDLLRYHEKRGGFPENLQKLEGVVWERKDRLFSAENRALNHRNYYYFYSQISPHQFTIWAIPTGKQREEAPTWFLVVSPEVCRRFKGAALPLEQIDGIEPNPTLKKLGIFGLIEQQMVDFKGQQKSEETFKKK
ncbi:MAG TPA: hypothetical protein PKY82_20415 [Pyrinomonadaceae bacterium]|nr:hypothetical protein [Pyrinomonadaceae bacterium]